MDSLSKVRPNGMEQRLGDDQAANDGVALLKPASTIDDLRMLMCELTPADGSTVTKEKLQQEWLLQCKRRFGVDLQDSDFESISVSLLESGELSKWKGRGGTFRRNLVKAVEPTLNKGLERDLYEPFLQTLEKSYTEEQEIKYFVSYKTAQQGSRATGGKWTRPDITLIAVPS